jgi:hypothetical protein
METFEGFAGTSVVADVNDFRVFLAAGDVKARHWSGRLAWTPGNVYVDDPSEYEPSEFSPDGARDLAAALVYAADEAEGRGDRPHAVQIGVPLTVGALMDFHKTTKASERLRIAAFIRANVNTQGLDFPDAEAVADWLEGK